ncbi:MAG: copper amine oxidase N-terminal domain-containing protein [Clostridia bacterium]|nr:copper amine oxidase N-terminal domain-containing protein [Clostridia bacterium]
MKTKFISIVMVVIMTISLLVPCTVFAEDEIKVTLNGQQIYFDQPPVIVEGRTLVPVRAIFEAMGAIVSWDGEKQMIQVITDFGIMLMTIGNPMIIYRSETEDRSVVTDVPPMIINNRTLVPVRAIAETTGYDVQWDNNTRTVVITGEMYNPYALPEADIKGYYEGTQTPDFGACLGVELASYTNGEYIYNEVKGDWVVDYIETYLVSAGFVIEGEYAIDGQFRFELSHSLRFDNVTIRYSKPDKQLRVKCWQGSRY